MMTTTKKIIATAFAAAAMFASAQGPSGAGGSSLLNRLQSRRAQADASAGTTAAAQPQPQQQQRNDPGEVTMSSETSVMQMDGAPLELDRKSVV